MHAEDLERIRKYRLGQAEERGVLNAARSWFALRPDAYDRGPRRAEFIENDHTVVAECRDDTIRVWGGDPQDFARGGGDPMTTPEKNLVLEVVREMRVDGYDYVLDGYVPGDWELVFFAHVSSLCLERRLEDRRRAIADEAKDREVLQRQMRRWDV